MRADKLSIIGPINWGDLQINRFSDQLVIQSVVGGTSSIIGSLGGTTGPQGFQGPTGSGGGDSQSGQFDSNLNIANGKGGEFSTIGSFSFLYTLTDSLVTCYCNFIASFDYTNSSMIRVRLTVPIQSSSLNIVLIDTESEIERPRTLEPVSPQQTHLILPTNYYINEEIEFEFSVLTTGYLYENQNIRLNFIYTTKSLD
jgi:hypothetical protein